MRLLYCFLSVVLSLTLHSCGHSFGNQGERNKQKDADSILKNLHLAQIVDDTMAVWDTIDECNKLLAQEENHDKRYSLLQKKASLLSLIGEYKKAFSVQEEAVELLDSNNPKRLELTAFKYYLQGDTNAYEEILNRAIVNCRTDYKDRETTIRKSILYILIGNSLSGKKELRSFLDKHADQTVQEVYDNFSTFKKQILEGRNMLVEKMNEEPVKR